MDRQEINPQMMAVLVDISRRLTELRNVLILVGIANNPTRSSEGSQAAESALDKLRELAEALNL